MKYLFGEKGTFERLFAWMAIIILVLIYGLGWDLDLWKSIGFHGVKKNIFIFLVMTVVGYLILFCVYLLIKGLFHLIYGKEININDLDLPELRNLKSEYEKLSITNFPQRFAFSLGALLMIAGVLLGAFPFLKGEVNYKDLFFMILPGSITITALGITLIQMINAEAEKKIETKIVDLQNNENMEFIKKQKSEIEKLNQEFQLLREYITTGSTSISLKNNKKPKRKKKKQSI